MARHEDWEDELSRPDSFPFSAALAGSVVLVAAGLFVQPRFAALPFWQVLAAALALALLLWGIAFLVTVRHATTAWKIGSLAMLVLVAATTALTGLVLANMRLREDMRTVAEFRWRIDGTPDFAAGAERRGPISRLYVGFVRGTVEDRQRFDKAVLELGVDLLTDPAGLQRTPGVLSKCGEIAGLKTLAAEVGASQRKRFRDFVAAVAALDVPPDFKRGMREAFERDDSETRQRATIAAQGMMLDETQAMCAVLARRRWTPEYRRFMFSNLADLGEFNRHAEARDKAIAEIRRIEAEGVQRMERSQRTLRQTLSF
jgi:hypothetical protein